MSVRRESAYTQARRLVKKLSSEPNKIITGAAGTGKTQLAIFLGERLKGSVLILVSTKTLSGYIAAVLKQRGSASKVNVLYTYLWHNNPSQYDYIIIDEVQDLSLAEINEAIKFALYGVYIFGDTTQRLFEKSWTTKQSTVTLETLQDKLGFETIRLTYNYRVSAQNATLINSVCREQMVNSSLSKPFKIIFVRCKSYQRELDKIGDILLNGRLKGTTVVCVQEKSQFREQVNQTTPNAKEIYEYLKLRGAQNLGYKQNYDTHLNFADQSTNILTYHSAKGLEFNNVILPFKDPLDQQEDKHLNYVAFTRATERIVITYSKQLHHRFPIDLLQ